MLTESACQPLSAAAAVQFVHGCSGLLANSGLLGSFASLQHSHTCINPVHLQIHNQCSTLGPAASWWMPTPAYSTADTRVSTDPLQYIEGRGKLVDAHTVDVGGKRITARHILSEPLPLLRLRQH